MIELLLEYEFIKYAILAGFLASLVCGIMGVIVVEKRLVMMTGGIAHTSYGGVGLGYLLGFEPILGAFLISIGAACCLAYMKQRGVSHSDVVLGLFWSLGMALGVVFISFAPGYPPDISSYLFGNILSVTRNDLYLMTGLSLLVVMIITMYFNHWKAYLFDEEFARIRGMKVSWLEYLLFLLIAVTIIILIRVVGIILGLALFIAPPALAALIAGSFRKRMLCAVLAGNVFCLGGLLLSFYFNIASGAAIVLLAAVGFFLTYAISATSVSKFMH